MLKSLRPMARPMLVLMAFTAIFGIAATGHSNNEPPPLAEGEHLTGPASVGTLVMSPGPTPESQLSVVFTGRCAGSDVSFTGVFNGFTFAKLVAAPDPTAQLHGRRIVNGTLLTLELAQCYSHSGATDLIINTVTRFSMTTGTATAEVVILAIKNPS